MIIQIKIYYSIFLIISCLFISKGISQENYQTEYYFKTDGRLYLLTTNSSAEHDLTFMKHISKDINVIEYTEKIDYSKLLADTIMLNDSTIKIQVRPIKISTDMTLYKNDCNIDFYSLRFKNINVMYRILNLGISSQSFIYSDTIADTKWTLYHNFEMFDGVNCQKAHVNFRCNDYEVWIDTSSAINVSPDLFNNPPGLVKKMKCIDNDREWVLKSVIKKEDNYDYLAHVYKKQMLNCQLLSRKDIYESNKNFRNSIQENLSSIKGLSKVNSNMVECFEQK